MSDRSERKKEHLILAGRFFNPKQKNSFDQLYLVRPTLPETAIQEISLTTTMFNKKIAAPFFIEAMTGGSKASFRINRTLGKAAADNGLPLALGSASILAAEPQQLDSFLVARKDDPDGILLANINPTTKPKKAQKIVEELKANALQIHLNAVQEAAMPEGERDFHWLNNLEEIRQTVTVPIILKEVGFGFDFSSLSRLKRAGFKYFDVSGSGGTNFAQIENQRNPNDVSFLEKIGLPTVITALLAKKAKVSFALSGGIRNPLDIFKGLALGGSYVGIANVFLQTLQKNGINALNKLIQNWKKDLTLLMTLYGVKTVKEITKVRKYYGLELKNKIDQLI